MTCVIFILPLYLLQGRYTEDKIKLKLKEENYFSDIQKLMCVN